MRITLYTAIQPRVGQGHGRRQGQYGKDMLQTRQTYSKDTERHGKNTGSAGQGHDKHMNDHTGRPHGMLSTTSKAPPANIWQARRELFRHVANARNKIANPSGKLNTERARYSRGAARRAAPQNHVSTGILDLRGDQLATSLSKPAQTTHTATSSMQRICSDLLR